MALGAVGAMQVAWERTRRVRARARGVRPPARRPPGDPPQARRHGRRTIEACRCVTYDALRRFVAGEDAAARGHDGQAAHPARVLRADRRVPADPRRRRLHARVRGRARRARRAARPDRRRHRRDHARDPRARARPGRPATRLPAATVSAQETPTGDEHGSTRRQGGDRHRLGAAASAARRRSCSSRRARRCLINDLDGDVAEQASAEIAGETAVYAGDLTKPGARRRARAEGDRLLRQDRHHRQQRRLHARRADPQDDRRAVPGDARHPHDRALPRDPRRRAAPARAGQEGARGRQGGVPQDRQHLLDLRHVRQRRPGQLLRRQGRRRRPDENASPRSGASSRSTSTRSPSASSTRA